MTLTELRYFLALAEEQHFGRAAERCFVSQPTLSIAIKKLEDSLGVTLFERHRGNIALTDVAEPLVEKARSILNQTKAFRDSAEQGKDQLSAPLKLGAIFTVGPYLFPHLLPELKKAAPEMPLYIEENYTSVLAERIKECALDAIVVAHPFEELDVVTMPLYEEPFVVMMPKGHRLAKCKTVDPKQLSQESLLLLGPGHCFRDQVLETNPELRAILNASHESGFQGNKLITEGSSLDTIRHMVASGFGITVLPLSAAMRGRYDQESVEVRPFAKPVPSRTIALAWRVTFPRPKAIEALKSCAGHCRVLERNG